SICAAPTCIATAWRMMAAAEQNRGGHCLFVQRSSASNGLRAGRSELFSAAQTGGRKPLPCPPLQAGEGRMEERHRRNASLRAHANPERRLGGPARSHWEL